MILDPAVQQFINDHVGADLTRLALQKNPFPNYDWRYIVNQIASKTKARDKLPTWFAAQNIIYPSGISVQQTSSEAMAQHKSQLISGRTIIDLTGGFGVDTFYFAKRFDTVVHCEQDADLSQIVAQNFRSLDVANVKCIAGDSQRVLSELNREFDWIYIDPSRRSDKGKVFMLRDCEPNVPSLLDFYERYSANIMIKTAPILDIASGLSEFRHVREIHIVALENEVKELLWIVENGFKEAVKIHATNIVKSDTFTFSFYLSEATPTYGFAKKFLYEPNAAIMKSGAFDEVSQRFKLDKLHPHSHLYTSDTLVGFPGRVFEIRRCIGYNKQEMKQNLQNKKANVTVRNFPDAVDTIRKKYKIHDGGDDYCFFTTDMNNDKIVLICAKI